MECKKYRFSFNKECYLFSFIIFLVVVSVCFFFFFFYYSSKIWKLCWNFQFLLLFSSSFFFIKIYIFNDYYICMYVYVYNENGKNYASCVSSMHFQTFLSPHFIFHIFIYFFLIEILMISSSLFVLCQDLLFALYLLNIVNGEWKKKNYANVLILHYIIFIEIINYKAKNIFNISNRFEWENSNKKSKTESNETKGYKICRICIWVYFFSLLL